MARIKINGESYKIYRDERDRYSWYYYRGELTERAPYDTRVVGYVRSGKELIAICKKINHKLNKAVYYGTALSGVLVCVSALLVFNMNIEVPEWVQREVIQRDTLDDGVQRVSSRLAYSEYATYDGNNVSLYVSSKKNADIALRFGDTTTDFVNVKDGYSIPMDLDIAEQGMVQGVLLYRIGDKIDEYPLVIEYPIIETVQLAQGSEEDAKQAYEEAVADKDTDSMLAPVQDVLTEPISGGSMLAGEDEDLLPPPTTYDTDWENFEVIIDIPWYERDNEYYE